jgi:hypothetical protein
MKKVKFLRLVRDKYNGKMYEKDSVREFEDWRANELVSDPRGLAEYVVDYDGMKVADLRELAGKQGINTKGMKKADIVKALAEVEK